MCKNVFGFFSPRPQVFFSLAMFLFFLFMLPGSVNTFFLSTIKGWKYKFVIYRFIAVDPVKTSNNWVKARKVYFRMNSTKDTFRNHPSANTCRWVSLWNKALSGLNIVPAHTPDPPLGSTRGGRDTMLLPKLLVVAGFLPSVMSHLTAALGELLWRLLGCCCYIHMSRSHVSVAFLLLVLANGNWPQRRSVSY